ncbi:MAG: FAD-binding and (Fe-S)-binding domain-containing protein [Actinomycetota bacterium]
MIMLDAPHSTLLDRLAPSIDPERCYTDPADTLAYGTDASFYRLIPKIVIQAESLDEISLILQEATALDVPVTFRAAGTSLSGQAISDSVLVLTSRCWTDIEVLDGGDRIRLQPGVVGRSANAVLAPYQRKIGPDPASINAAMIGGIVANNASGMCCGTAENSYQTLSSMRLVFADGTQLDTGDPASVEAFRRARPELIERIGFLAASTKANTPLAKRITAKYSQKNTMGYSLNALIDFDDPIDVITHLMVGSEGTLAFLGEVVLDTVLEAPHKASALVMFPSIAEACDAVTALKSAPVSAVELMDRASLRSVAGKPGVPAYLAELAEPVAALLVEVRATTPEGLAANAAAARAAIDHIDVERPYEFADDPDVYGGYWNIRKGLFPAVGAVRTIGTTVVIEDVTFPVDRLADATLDLQALFRRHGYDEAVIFGHALEGNLHFVFTQDFGVQAEIERYDRFIRELGDLVVGEYDGALKAEHGTGRNMSPFLEMEWGAEAVALMREIKDAFDPDGILNPGVILNPSPTSHLEHLKPLPPADPIIDTCIECGFCESSCISHDLTYSPRQRIVLQREVARLRSEGDDAQADALAASIAYGFDATCAADGLCAIACPVDIDTGKYVKQHRAVDRSDSRVANLIAGRFGAASAGARVAIRAAHATSKVIGTERMDKVASTLTNVVGDRTHWVGGMPRAAGRLPSPRPPLGADPMPVVYFTSCVNRIFGTAPDANGDAAVAQRVIDILHKANCEVIVPERPNDLCCGLAFTSQGFAEAGATAQRQLGERLLEASDGGRHPILCDMSPCTLEAVTGLGDLGLDIYDITNFTTTYLVDRLDFEPSDDIVSLFTVCSIKKLGLEGDLRRVGELCAAGVHVPETNCCGFAGNRGFTQPELNEWGLRTLAEQIPADVGGAYSTSRTCEIGLTEHSARVFDSLVKLIDEHTSPRST